MESVLAALVGLGLAASCGFRVFVPLLVVSASANTGYLELSDGFDWIGTRAALVAFAIATAAEIGAFYIPWLDHVLDMIASPIAVVAGAILFAAFAVDLNPFLRWSLAIIAGGGSAAIVQGGTVVSRLASTTTTGGLANFAVATIETLASFVFSILSIVVPVVAVALLLAAAGCMFYIGRRVLAGISRRDKPSAG
jgi:hypothetical protein